MRICKIQSVLALLACLLVSVTDAVSESHLMHPCCALLTCRPVKPYLRQAQELLLVGGSISPKTHTHEA
jgi:hypothetical protein